MSEQSFGKRRRLRKNWEFQKVYAQGQKKPETFFTLHWLKLSSPQETRIGICVGRKAGNAVLRNRIKRRLREAIRTYPQAFAPGYWLVIAAKKEMATAAPTPAKASLYLAIEEALGDHKHV